MGQFLAFIFLESVVLLFLFLAVLHRLDLLASALIRVMRADIFAFFSKLRERMFSLSPLSVILAVSFLWLLFTRFRKFPFFPSLLRIVVTNGHWIFKCFFRTKPEKRINFLL